MTPLSFHRSGHNLLGACPPSRVCHRQVVSGDTRGHGAGGEPPPYRRHRHR